MLAGSDQTTHIDQASGVSIARPYNERATAKFTMKHGYSVAKIDPVYLYARDGVTPIFGGLVFRRNTVGYGHLTMLAIEAVDWSVYGSWRDITLSYLVEGEPSPPVSLKTVLTAIVAVLAALGVTLDPAQVDGPMVVAFDWDHKPISEALRDLSTETGYSVHWSPTKVLSMALPGSVSAPVAITDGALNAQSMGWDDSLENYATRVHLLCGPSGVGETWESWMGDGATDSWVTTMKATKPDPTYVREETTVGGVTTIANRTVTTKTVFNIKSSSESPAAVAITSSSVAAQTEILFGAVHGLEAGDTMVVAGHAGSTPSLNGTHVVAAKLSPTRVLLNVAVTVGGTGGTGQHTITTITTTADHNFSVGDTLKIAGDTSTPPLNGTHVAGAVSGDTVAIVALVTTAGGQTGTITESAADYLWVRATHTLSVDNGTIPAANQIITLFFMAKFPFRVTAESGASPAVVHWETAPEIVTKDVGQARAEGILAAMYQDPVNVDMTTQVDGFEPGQALPVSSVIRGIDLDALITSVDVALISDGYWEYTIKASGIDASTVATYQGSPLDYFREIGGGSSGATLSGASGGTTVVQALTSPYPLGGSLMESVPADDWANVKNPEPFLAKSTFSARVRVTMRAVTVDVGVTARLATADGTTVAGTSSKVIDTVERVVRFNVVLIAGKEYFLQHVIDTPGEEPFCKGTLENL